MHKNCKLQLPISVNRWRNCELLGLPVFTFTVYAISVYSRPIRYNIYSPKIESHVESYLGAIVVC